MHRRAVLLALGAVGFASARPGLAASLGVVPAAATLALPVIPPRDASALMMTDADGARVPLARFAGGLLVLNFWAPWCLPCRLEMPSLSRLAAGGEFTVLPLCFDWQGAAGVRRFYREVGIDNLPVLLGDGPNLQATLGLSALPSTAIISAKGEHIATVSGEAQWDDAATLLWLRDLAAG